MIEVLVSNDGVTVATPDDVTFSVRGNARVIDTRSHKDTPSEYSRDAAAHLRTLLDQDNSTASPVSFDHSERVALALAINVLEGTYTVDYEP